MKYLLATVIGLSGLFGFALPVQAQHHHHGHHGMHHHHHHMPNYWNNQPYYQGYGWYNPSLGYNIYYSQFDGCWYYWNQNSGCYVPFGGFRHHHGHHHHHHGMHHHHGHHHIR